MSANNNTNIIDVSGLSPFNYGSQAPLWWGFVGMIIIESTVIATLIACYLYLKMGSISWPPAGTGNPDLLLPTINTVILLASSVSMHWADSSIERGKQRQLTYGLIISILLAMVFLTVKAYEYSHLSYDWSTHSYGSIVWGISVFHAIHVLSLILKTVFVLYLELQGYFDRQRRLGVTVNGMYWHFVVGAWVPLYLVLYWSPRIL